jgi:hypothetical protein
LFTGGYKITRKPASFYSPNEDFAADIQIADYKTLFGKMQTRFPHMDSYIIFNDAIDSQLWYLPGRPPDATFVKDYTAGLKYDQSSIHPITHKPIYTSLKQFQEQVKRHPKGVIIVEDWQSMLPDEIKDYVKKNLKLQIRVDSLPQVQSDSWPLEVYSWGM